MHTSHNRLTSDARVCSIILLSEKGIYFLLPAFLQDIFAYLLYAPGSFIIKHEPARGGSLNVP